MEFYRLRKLLHRMFDVGAADTRGGFRAETEGLSLLQVSTGYANRFEFMSYLRFRKNILARRMSFQLLNQDRKVLKRPPIDF